MSLLERYNPALAEPLLQERWQAEGIYDYEGNSERPVYAIDTPPPTVSGNLHLGHVYSYSQTDFLARFWRMSGYNVFYPMGFDDNGLPTERLVERTEGVSARELGREQFIERCLAVSRTAEREYESLWKRLGLSIDWRFSYRTIDADARRISQLSFIDLYRKGLAYRGNAPAIWCPECRTAIAQAELNDLVRRSDFYVLDFALDDGGSLPIATTRPELLPACVAVFVHPDDDRFSHLAQRMVTVPIFGHRVPVLLNPGAEPQKGTGAVMCCTFGDKADVEWWYSYKLPLIEAIGKDGRMTSAAGAYSGLAAEQARQELADVLKRSGSLLDQSPITQSIRVHERCDTPVEYIVTQQWFIRLLDAKEQFLRAGENIEWHPDHMKNRYAQWVENLGWDWCISRQRYFGVTFPVWYCDDCGQIILAEEDDLPVDPSELGPGRPCTCGGLSFTPERDVMDTWATSSMTPQIVGRWGQDSALYEQVFPMELRPQAHEIIRTWAFYSIVKSLYHFDTLPWRSVAISGWGLAPEGSQKLSKSRGGGAVGPMEMIERYSADAVRYWAASTSLGKDAYISEERIRAGAKLVTKLWNVARFCRNFISDYSPPDVVPPLSPADRWILTSSDGLIRRVTELFRGYDYATAKSEVETFFWRDLTDNYLEMVKQRLYSDPVEGEEDRRKLGARFALHRTLLTTIKLLAPVLPYVTEQIYLELFAGGNRRSIHVSDWPSPLGMADDSRALEVGEILIEVATAVRRYKSNEGLSLGTDVRFLRIAPADPSLAADLNEAAGDLGSITRAQVIEVVTSLDTSAREIHRSERIAIGLTV